MRRTRQIERRNLQVAAINVAVVKRRRSRNRHFLFKTPPLRVVSTVDDGLRCRILKTNRTVFSVVGDTPRSRRGLNQRRIPVRVVARIKHGEHRVHGVAFLCVLRVLCVNSRIFIQRVHRVGVFRSLLSRAFD